MTCKDDDAKKEFFAKLQKGLDEAFEKDEYGCDICQHEGTRNGCFFCGAYS